MVGKKHRKQTAVVGLFIGLVFLIGDRSSVVLFKDMFQRLRPCHNPEITNLVHTLDGHCGGQYGFVSSHATNSFALAIFSGLLLKKQYPKLLLIMLLWAALVSYSRIYVGVHYPADILGGAILGTTVGLLTFWLMRLFNKKLKLNLKDI